MAFHLRVARLDDAAAIAAIYAPYVAETAISFEEVPPTPAVMYERMNSGIHLHPWLALEGAGGVEAYACATTHRARAAYRWAADVAVYSSRSASPRAGRGRALYDALLQLLTAQGYTRAYGGVSLPNEASEGLHLAMGFRVVGTYAHIGYKFGRWHDVRWYERALSSGDEQPCDMPIDWRDFASSDRARSIISEPGGGAVRLP